MRKKDIIIKYFLVIAVCIVFMLINNKVGIISMPSDKDMADYQFNMFTISSVFAGFAFTMLGMLLGMSSEKLIERIRKTNIITRKCEKIVFSLICFCSSGIFSLVLILGIDVFLDTMLKIDVFDNIFFILVVVFLVAGLIYFIISIKELTGLIKRIYGCSEASKKQQRKEYEVDMEEMQKRTRETKSNFIE